MEIHNGFFSKLVTLWTPHPYRQEHTVSESAIFQCVFFNFVHLFKLLSPSVVETFCMGQQNHLVLFVYIQDTGTFMSRCLGVYFCVLVSLLIFCNRIILLLIDSCFYQHYSAYCEISILFQLFKQNFVTLFLEIKKTEREREREKKNNNT